MNIMYAVKLESVTTPHTHPLTCGASTDKPGHVRIRSVNGTRLQPANNFAWSLGTGQLTICIPS